MFLLKRRSRDRISLLLSQGSVETSWKCSKKEVGASDRKGEAETDGSFLAPKAERVLVVPPNLYRSSLEVDTVVNFYLSNQQQVGLIRSKTCFILPWAEQVI